MNREEYYKPCTKCGRPQTYCRGECCGTPKCKTDTCIRYGKPGCGCDAVIPTATVATKADIKGLTNCFVHVADTNTTFYVDDKGAAIETWAGLASVNNYDFDANPLNFRNQIVYDYDADKAAIYNQWGDHAEFPIGVTPESYNWLTEKPSINGVTLQGNKSLDDLGISSAINDAAEGAVDEMIEKTALVFDTVADMKASTDLVDGGYARTLGFHTLNDGGGAVYKITNTGTADEMSVIAVGSLYANLVLPAVIYPEQFGAYGDGTHDDTNAVHKAIEYADANFKCVKAIKKYKLTASLNVENLANGYINIDGETPAHSYMQSGVYGYNIGGSFIVDGVELLAGAKTKAIRGSIRNLTIIPVTKNSSIDLFYKVKFSGFHFSGLSIFYFKNILSDCACNASTYIEGSVIQFIESLIYGDSYIESCVRDNYITGLSGHSSSCFNTYLYGSEIKGNFIEYFDYIYNNQRDSRVLAEFTSHGNTYDFFGTVFGLKTDDTALTYVGLISTQDTFSNWSGANAILLPTTNMKVIIKSPIVKPKTGNLSFVACSGNLYATDATFLWIDNILSIVANKPTINITFWSTNQQNRRVYIENLDYISVNALPSFGFIGQHVIYNSEVYLYISSGVWKQLS